MAVSRVSAFLDTFGGALSGYDEGPGIFATMAVSGGFLQPSITSSSDCFIARNGETYAPDQFSTGVLNNINSGVNYAFVAVRCAGSNESCYWVDRNADGGSGRRYGIYEIASGGGTTQLASTGTPGTLTGPVELTLEAEGSDLRAYSDEGGSDTNVLSASDSTITSGSPGLGGYTLSSAADVRYADFYCGQLFQQIGSDFLVCVGSYSSGVGDVTPAIPTILTDAADYLPLLVAHSAGGETIALGTANGFSELTNSPSATGAGTAGVKVAVFGNTSGAGGSAPVITDPGNHCGGLILLAWHPDGLPTVDITAANQKASASTSFSISGDDTTVDGALVLAVSGRDTDSAAAAYSGVTNASLASLAEIFDAGTTQGNGGGLGIFAGIKTTAGTVDATTGTVASSINANYFLALAPASAGQTIAMGLCTETDSALAMAHLKSKALGLNTETDSALAAAVRKTLALGLTSESDAALAMAFSKLAAIGLTAETDEALPLQTSHVLALGLTTETDSALAMAFSKLAAIGLTTEGDSAFAVTPKKDKALGLVSESDSALEFTAVRVLVLGLPAETDTAFAFGRAKTRTLGLATELDSALGFTSTSILVAVKRFLRDARRRGFLRTLTGRG